MIGTNWSEGLLSQCIKELSLDDRPREKLIQQGAAGLSNSELLAI